ncbi:type VII secretion integral membrane protein EccD [Dactylosporangium sp. CA-092794]|uniref:type VII secretion integral membrane protein EccD n=1 Tax=Dactylosporangium sp. CA-092794 TaxID=3239929 RepID=UPI003D89DD15
MATGGSVPGLARVIIALAGGRFEMAIPEHPPLHAVLPALLGRITTNRSGDGWAVRRTDGSPLDPKRSLGQQQVRDGEVLHLVPPDVEWPEPAYEERIVLDVGARGAGPPRTAGSLVAAVVLVSAPVALLPVASWPALGAAMLAAAVLLVGAGAVTSRLGSAGTGTALGVLGLLYGFAGGLLAVGGTRSPLGMGAPHLLVASSVLLVLSVGAYIQFGRRGRAFVGGILAGFTGLVSGLVALGPLDSAGTAALAATALLVLMPGMPLLSVRMGRVPTPSVPRGADELLAGGDPVPDRVVRDRVLDSHALLTGGLVGIGAALSTAVAALAAAGGTAQLLLAGAASAAMLLRARLFVVLGHRLVVLFAGLVGALATAAGVVHGMPATLRLGLVVPLLVSGAAIVCAAGLTYSRRRPSPQLGRLGDVFDVLLTLALAVVAADVLGLYHQMRGLGG